MNRSLFNEIIKSHGDNVYTIAYHTVLNEMAAEDITQDVFIKIFKNYDAFKGDAQLSTWIYRITKNACYDYFRKEKQYLEMAENEDLFLIDRDQTVEKELDEHYQKLELRDVLDKLPPKLRMAVNLYYFHEHSYENVAKIMDIPLNTLKSYMRRAKIKLADLIKKP